MCWLLNPVLESHRYNATYLFFSFSYSFTLFTSFSVYINYLQPWVMFNDKCFWKVTDLKIVRSFLNRVKENFFYTFKKKINFFLYGKKFIYIIFNQKKNYLINFFNNIIFVICKVKFLKLNNSSWAKKFLLGQFFF